MNERAQNLVDILDTALNTGDAVALVKARNYLALLCDIYTEDIYLAMDAVASEWTLVWGLRFAHNTVVLFTSYYDLWRYLQVRETNPTAYLDDNFVTYVAICDINESEIHILRDRHFAIVF